MDRTKLKDLIERTVVDQFSKPVVAWVESEFSVDENAEDVVRVTVVVNGSIRSLDPHKLVSLGTRLWSRLDEAGSKHFPLVSVMTRADAVKRHRAAA